MMDVDDFSRINDTQGPAVGDVLLKDVAHRLQHCLRDSKRRSRIGTTAPENVIKDWVARTGGDEFGLALPGCRTRPAPSRGAARADGAGAALRVRAAGNPAVGHHGNQPVPMRRATPEALVNNADAAMHHGKKAGIRGHRVLQQIDQHASRQAPVAGGRFEQSARPARILPELSAPARTQGSQVEAVEALLRWTHPQRGFVPPDEFIPLAEQSGLITEIGDWVLREACAQVRRWRDAGAPRWQVAVNVSGVQFRDGTPGGARVRAPSRPRHRIAHDRAGIHRRRLDRIFGRGEQGGEVPERARRATALDDFGTGYSSMSYLGISRSIP